jgi:hypothetical protein
VAGTTLSILLVGVIYFLLLHGLVELSGGSRLANLLLHFATPILVPLFWIIFTPKGQLGRQHPLFWAIYPLAYLIYALGRGGATGIYPYPFINVARIGWAQTVFNSFAIGVSFLACGYGIVWLDKRLYRFERE